MIQRANRALPCADAGPVGATIFLIHAPQEACAGKRGDQLAKAGRENRRICTAWRHAIGRPAHRSPQP